jgi:hypothetical protein
VQDAARRMGKALFGANETTNETSNDKGRLS